MTRFVLVCLALLSMLPRAADAQTYDLTLPPVNVDAVYVQGATLSIFYPLTLGCGPTGFVIDGPYPSGGVFLQQSGTSFSPPAALTDALGRMGWQVYGDPVDQVASFVFCDVPVSGSAYAMANPERRYGLCSLRIDPSNTAASTGVRDIFVTDFATGAKVGGATVTFGGAPVTEVGTGQYRITVISANASTNTTAGLVITKAPYQTLSFTTTVVAGQFSSQSVAMVDPTPGAVQASSNAASTTAANPIPVSIHFTKAVSSSINPFTANELTVAGGTILSFDGAGQDFVAQIVPTASSVSVSVAAGVAADAAGILNAASPVLSRTYDGGGPTVTIEQAVGQADPASTYPVRFDIVFSAPVTGFTGNDVVFSAIAPQPIIRTLTGGGASYTLEVSGMSGPGTLTATIPADAAIAATGGKPSKASTSVDNTVGWALQPNYTLPIIYRHFTYSTSTAPSTEFIDVALGANAWMVGMPSRPETLLFQVSGGADGSAITSDDTAVSDATGIVRVRASNFPSGGSDATDAFVYSLTAPGTANRQFGYVHLTMENASDVALTIGGAYVTLTDGSGAKVTGASVSYGLNVADARPLTEVAYGVYRLVLSNVVVGSFRVRAAGFTDVIDQVRSLAIGNFPEFPIVLTQSSLVASIASAAAEPTHARAIPLTFSFSSPVSDFTVGDVTVTNGAISGFAGSGSTYTATLIPTNPGTVRVEIASGSANAGGFACDAAVFTRTYDTVGPTVTIDQAAGQADPSVSGPLAYTVVFSAPVTGFTGADLGFAGSTAGGPITAVVAGSGTTWTANVSGMTTGGTVVVSVLADAALFNGHPSAASTSADNSVTFVAPGVGSPTVTIDQHPSQPDPSTSSVVLFSVHFSAPVADFTASDVVLSGSAGGPLSAVVSGSGTDYTVLVSGMSSAGTVIADIPGGAASSAGLPSFAATSSDHQVTYAPASGTGSGAGAPTAADGGSCGAGSGLALLALGAMGLLAGGRRRRA